MIVIGRESIAGKGREAMACFHTDLCQDVCVCASVVVVVKVGGGGWW